MIKEAIEIFRKDINTIKSTPLTLIILIGIIVIPSIYALPNITAMWNPYSQTSSIKVAVVNEDLGYNINGTECNIGNDFVDALKNNTDFNWQFIDENTALTGLQDGKYYAVLIIPGNFSEGITSIATSNPHRAQIEYLVNDKLNPISPRIINAGVNIIQAKINDEVAKTVDGIVFGKLADVGELAKENKAQFLNTRSLVNEMNNNVGSIDSSITEANSDLSTVTEAWSQLRSELPEMKSNADYAKNEYDTFYSYVSGNPSKAVTTVQDMKTKVSTLITNLQYMEALLTTLYQVTGDENLKPIITEVGGDINDANNTRTTLNEVESDLQSVGTTNRLSSLKTSIDQMDNGVNTLYNNQDQISQKINTAALTLNLVNSKWPTFKNVIHDAASKLNQVSDADINNMAALSNIDPEAVENYFESPVNLEKKEIYPVNNYGSAVAPFYISLALWIGCLICVVMMNMKVISRKKYSSKSVYLGKMGIFLIISIFQALIMALGILWLHVQISSTALFILTMIYMSLCFMIIVYSLASLFGDIGKLIAMIFLILQITASGGIYQVELLPTVFQTIYPYLPFTYAVSALRELIAGVIWTNYLQSIVTLTIFPISIFILTLFTKEKLDKMTQKIEDKLKRTGLFQ